MKPLLKIAFLSIACFPCFPSGLFFRSVSVCSRPAKQGQVFSITLRFHLPVSYTHLLFINQFYLFMLSLQPTQVQPTSLQLPHCKPHSSVKRSRAIAMTVDRKSVV